MVKAFLVSLKVDKKPIIYGSISVSSSTYSLDSHINNNEIFVIANNMTEVSHKYPTAQTISEVSDNVDILDSVKIICPVK